MATEFHWHEDETDKKDRPTGRFAPVVPPLESPRRRWPRWVGLALLFLASIAIGVGGAVWFLSQRGLSAARADLEAVLRTEAQALARGDQELYRSLQDAESAQQLTEFFERVQGDMFLRAADQVDAEQPLRIAHLELLEDRAWAEVAFTRNGVPYRRMQFYRLSEGRWRRTLPDPRFWGEVRNRKTTHFLFIYHEREEGIINALAPWAEETYRRILSDFQAPAWNGAIIIEFRTEEAGRAIDLVNFRFALPSPFLLGYRADGRLDGLLRSSIAYDLALVGAVSRTGLFSRQARYRNNWLMLNAVVQREVERLVPDGMADAEAKAEQLRQAVRHGEILPLRAFWPPFDLRSARDFNLALIQAQSLLDYAEEVAGDAAVPALLLALGQQKPWDDALLYAFNVEAARFEAGWLAWLQARYGPTP